MEVLGKGKAVPYLRCIEGSTGKPPEPCQPKKSGSAWPNCWAAPVTLHPPDPDCCTRSMPRAGIASSHRLRCTLQNRRDPHALRSSQ